VPRLSGHAGVQHDAQRGETERRQSQLQVPHASSSWSSSCVFVRLVPSVKARVAHNRAW